MMKLRRVRSQWWKGCKSWREVYPPGESIRSR